MFRPLPTVAAAFRIMGGRTQYSQLKLRWMNSDNLRRLSVTGKGNGHDHLFNDLDPSSSSNRRPPNKGDLYSSQDLRNLLDLHESLFAPRAGLGPSPSSSSSQSAPQGQENDADKEDTRGGSPSIHDWVLRALSEGEGQAVRSTVSSNSSGGNSSTSGGKDDRPAVGDDDNGNNKDSRSQAAAILLSNTPTRDHYYPLSPALRACLSDIRAMAVDVDGTMLAEDHTMPARTEQAIIRAMEAVRSPTHPLQWFFPATGKSRQGALASLGAKVESLLATMPGVFLQGLYCVDDRGNVIFERRLPTAAVEAAQGLATRCSLSLFGYDGDTILASTLSNPDHIHEFHCRWGEPEPVVMDQLAQYPTGFHKMILMDYDQLNLSQRVRPQLEQLARDYNCTVTQAVPTMLELLPAGCAKEVGVQKLCEHLGIKPSTQLVAVGNAENDMGMVRMAACGVAVGNALPMLKEVADVNLVETNDEGGAGVAIDLFGLGQILELE